MAYAVIWGTVVSLIIEAVLIAGIELCGHYVIYCPLLLMDSFSLPHNRIHPVSKLFLSKITSYEWFVTVIQGLDAVIVPSTTAIILYYLACLLEISVYGAAIGVCIKLLFVLRDRLTYR